MGVDVDIKAIHERVKLESAFVERLKREVQKVIVGQEYMIDRLLIGILCEGHLLLEGVPGLAKTLTVKTLASAIQTGFQRIQFTPDLLPADLIGTMIFDQKRGEFVPHQGPIFSNIILADEINRAPAKVQSALLEAMQERQVSIGGRTFPLDDPFLVMATENPIEQEGTYPLPEAQVDRFMLKLLVTYPNKKEEKQILERMTEPCRTDRRAGGLSCSHSQRSRRRGPRFTWMRRSRTTSSIWCSPHASLKTTSSTPRIWSSTEPRLVRPFSWRRRHGPTPL